MQNYEVQYVVRNIGSGIPGRHNCTGCGRLFVKNELFEIASVGLSDDKHSVVNVHQNDECRNDAVSSVTESR